MCYGAKAHIPTKAAQCKTALILLFLLAHLAAKAKSASRLLGVDVLSEKMQVLKGHMLRIPAKMSLCPALVNWFQE